VLERVKLLQELFVKELEIARIDYRLAQDWSGDSSIFFDVPSKGRPFPPRSLPGCLKRSQQLCFARSGAKN